MYQSVDVSWPQGDYTPDPAEQGVFVAATSGDGGSLFTQATFAQDANNARAAGKALGFYHFNGGQDAAASADYFWSVIRGYYQPGDLLALDIESYSGGTIPAQSPAWAMAFVSRLAADMGVSLATLRPGIYGNQSTMSGSGWGALEAAGCWLWLAAPGGYPENTPLGEWTKWTILQYSSAGNIDRDESEYTYNQISQEGDMPLTPADIGLLLNFPAWTGGPTISSALKALFEADFVGGTSMPDGHKPMDESLFEIHSIVTALAAQVKAVSAPVVDVNALATAIVAQLPAESLTAADVAAALQPALAAIPAAVVTAEGKALSNG